MRLGSAGNIVEFHAPRPTGRSGATGVWVSCVLAMALCMARPLQAADETCRPVSPSLAARVTDYLAQRIVSESGGVPSIISTSRMPGTCYEQLVIRVSGTANPLILYLSPDQRFLTSTLYDLSSDPKQEAARVAADVERLLARDESPQLSGSHRRVTLVEFADLQCPYCRRFAEWYSSLPVDLLNETTLVFKHLPLGQHSWAQLAAQYSACANEQSATAFWELAGFLLAHQEEITPANFEDKANSILSRSKDVNAQALATCATTGLGPSLVARDTAIAKELAVSSTPTLFIDGRRAPPLHSAEDLRLLLQNELRDHSTNAGAGGQ